VPSKNSKRVAAKGAGPGGPRRGGGEGETVTPIVQREIRTSRHLPREG